VLTPEKTLKKQWQSEPSQYALPTECAILPDLDNTGLGKKSHSYGIGKRANKNPAAAGFLSDRKNR
jgi:hypothetical protein